MIGSSKVLVLYYGYKYDSHVVYLRHHILFIVELYKYLF